MADIGCYSSYSTGRAHSGETDIIMRPLDHLYGDDTLGVVYCHGSNRTAADTLNRGEPNISDFVEAIATVHPTIVTDLGGGTTWGNATAQTRIGEAITALRTATGCDATRFILAGVSMGGLASWRYAQANPDDIAAIVTAIPVCNLTEIYETTANSGMIDAIAAAWGVSSGADLPAGADPYADAGDLSGIPIGMWYSSGDTLCLPASAAAFATASGAESTVVTGSHGDSAVGNIDLDDVLTFLAGVS